MGAVSRLAQGLLWRGSMPRTRFEVRTELGRLARLPAEVLADRSALLEGHEVGADALEVVAVVGVG